MKSRKNGALFEVTLSSDELNIIIGSIREALEAVEDWEYQTLLGYEKTEARALLGALRELS